MVPNEGASINQQITQRATAKGGQKAAHDNAHNVHFFSDGCQHARDGKGGCSQEFEAQQGVLANRGHGAHQVFAVYMFLNALNPAEWVKPKQA